MKNSIQSILITFFGCVPAIALLIVCFFSQDSNDGFTGLSLLVAVALLCACVSILVARNKLHAAEGHAQTQTDNAEMGVEAKDNDQPPLYDAVVTKPPLYHDLYPVSSIVYSKDSTGEIQASSTPTHTLRDFTPLSGFQTVSLKSTEPPLNNSEIPEVVPPNQLPIFNPLHSPDNESAPKSTTTKNSNVSRTESSRQIRTHNSIQSSDKGNSTGSSITNNPFKNTESKNQQTESDNLQT